MAPTRPTNGRELPKPALAEVPAEAVQIFEQAMAALQRHGFEEARSGFEALILRFTNERFLVDRAKVYLEICARSARQAAPVTLSLEERLTAATAAFNNDNVAEARRLAQGVVSEQPANDAALYLLAAISAAENDTDGALSHLRRAVDISPDIRGQIKHDPDFTALHELDGFRALLVAPRRLPAQPARPVRLRRARAGR